MQQRWASKCVSSFLVLLRPADIRRDRALFQSRLLDGLLTACPLIDPVNLSSRFIIIDSNSSMLCLIGCTRVEREYKWGFEIQQLATLYICCPIECLLTFPSLRYLASAL